jgi:hypothetical protein
MPLPMSSQDAQESDAGQGGWSRFVASADGGAASTPCWGHVSAAMVMMVVENRRGLSLAAWAVVVVVLLVCSVGVPSILISPAIAPASAAPVTALEAADLRDEVGY